VKKKRIAKEALIQIEPSSLFLAFPNLNQLE